MPTLDLATAHNARVYDYLIGGKDNFGADRILAERLLELCPGARDAALENRRFLARAVRFLARDRGIRQFLDIGVGFPIGCLDPTIANTDEIARRWQPTARVVYVDRDPVVLTHARALLPGTRLAPTRIVEGDLRDPEAILAHPAVTDILDLREPVGLLLGAVLHLIPDLDDPARIVGWLTRNLPVGSHVVLSHATADFGGGANAAAITEAYRADVPLVPRSGQRIAKMLTGLDLIAPGLVPVSRWRPVRPPRRPATTPVYGVVGVRSGPSSRLGSFGGS